ncbi:MAG: ATP-binding protein [Candidatus Saganbacteria bacterium]|nr:ATP-binding protein [Candidatus Saganbacteria bacterium]
MKKFTEKDWQQIVSTLQEAVFVCDQDHVIRWANPKLTELLEKPLKEILGKKCFHLFHAKEEPIDNCPFAKKGTKKESQSMEIWEPHLNRHFSINTGCFRQSGGKAVYLVHAVSDLTEAKNREKELVVRLEELEEINKGLKKIEQMKSDFVSMVSHELRTPMTVIKEASTLLLTRELQVEKQKEYLQMIGKHVSRLNRLISDLLDLSRIGTGKLVLKQEPLHVGRLVGELSEIIFPIMQEKEIVFVQSIEKDLPLVVGDKERFLQVVANLIGNAIKFTPRGGEITLIITKEADEIMVKVIDTGRGLTPEQLKHVFDRFYIGDEILTRASGGTGLGLTIAQGLVEVMGGKIWGMSEGEGKGSAFAFSLPIKGKI